MTPRALLLFTVATAMPLAAVTSPAQKAVQRAPHVGIQPGTQAGTKAGTQPDAQAAVRRAPGLGSRADELRINKLIQQMTLDEKMGQLVQYNDVGSPAATAADSATPALAANPQVTEHVDALSLAASGRLGSMLNTIGAARTHAFQKAAVEQSRLHIPILFGADVIHGYRTIYPIPLGLAAAWDPDMVTEVSRLAAVEATTAGVRWFYSPMVDISRDARWGRTSEGAGEDPYLGSAMAQAYIRGYQGSNLADPASVAASVKHYAAYGAAEAGREYNTTDMSDVRLRQTYLPPYHAAVQAGAATMMSSFNALNGVPATGNHYLMTDILRNEWGFPGFVVSDYTAVKELLSHGTALTPADATREAINAGVEVDMMSHFYDTQLPGLVKSGQVKMATIDEAVRRVLRVKMALGLFEHPYERGAGQPGAEVTTAVAEHRPAVRRAAEESLVLLRNEGPVLPLRSGQSIALIGPLADDSGEMQGAWGGGSRVTDVVTLRDAFGARAQKAGGKLLYSKGTELETTSEAGFAEALNAARQADVVVMALGESSSMSGEAGSRAHLDLPGNQQRLLEQVAATGKPVVLLVFSGRPLVLTWASQHVASIMEVWFPGTEAGNALADVLYGDVAPSGKLPSSFPETVGQEPLYYNQFPTGRPAGDANLNVGPTGDSRFISRYIDAPNAALYPFGFGLSYTTFAYSGVSVSAATLPTKTILNGSGKLMVQATVKNTGTRPATEVVQCYTRNLGASLEQPVRELKGFQRITLAPGESRQVSFPLGFNELSFYGSNSRRTVEPTDYTVWVGGSSLAEQHAEFTLR